MTVEVPSRVKRQIKNLDRSIQSEINAAFKALEADPRPSNCIKIENEVGMWRIRIGEYRIAYHILKDKIEVVRAAHRSKFYARKEL